MKSIVTCVSFERLTSHIDETHTYLMAARCTVDLRFLITNPPKRYERKDHCHSNVRTLLLHVFLVIGRQGCCRNSLVS